MPTFRAVTVGRGNVGGIVRALELQLGIEAGGLGPRVAVGLGRAVATGVGTIVVVEELVTLFKQLQQIDQALDQLGRESIRRRQLERQASAIALRIEEIEAGLVMPPMWIRDP